MTKRLIEEWLPIAELGEESMRERRSMTALPPIYLHVWWARRPLVASRAAVLASLLPADADCKSFMDMLGIHGDPVAAKKRIEIAKKKGEKLKGNPYGYARAFQYRPTDTEIEWMRRNLASPSTEPPILLDPTSGGGSIPLESLRLGCKTYANDLNPVAAFVQKATHQLPLRHGSALATEFTRLADRFIDIVSKKLACVYPEEEPGANVVGYIWARTVTCPYCEGVIPLSPVWKLGSDGAGLRLIPHVGKGPGDSNRTCSPEIAYKKEDHSEGTVKGGDATCPFPDCSRVIDSEIIKSQAVEHGLGEQLVSVVLKKSISRGGSFGRGKRATSVVTEYRAQGDSDRDLGELKLRLEEKIPEWEALDILPSELFPEVSNDDRPLRYGMPMWKDLFSPRQLYAHCTHIEAYRDLLGEVSSGGEAMPDLTRSALAYICVSIDNFLNYNSGLGRWDSTLERIRSKFDRHDYAFVWSYAEMASVRSGHGLRWSLEKTGKCIKELVELFVSDEQRAFCNAPLLNAAPVSRTSDPALLTVISCGPADSVSHIPSGTVDAVVMDPPYYDNVMYAELSDFFYVWLKRMAGLLYPELFMAPLTDKENEAVANPALHKGKKAPRPWQVSITNRRWPRSLRSVAASSRTMG
jgi:adenine-specific DNA methylase